MRQFSFIFPLTQCVKDNSRREGLRYDHAGDWLVSGNCSKRLRLDEFRNQSSVYEYKIEEIVYRGTDINPILDTPQILESVKAACLNHIEGLFSTQDTQRKIPAHHKIGSLIGKVIPIHRMFRKVK